MVGEGHTRKTDAHNFRQCRAFRQSLPYKVQGNECRVVQGSIPLPGNPGREGQLVRVVTEGLNELLIVLNGHGPVRRGDAESRKIALRESTGRDMEIVIVHD